MKTALGSRINKSGLKSQFCSLDSVLEEERHRVSSGHLLGD